MHGRENNHAAAQAEAATMVCSNHWTVGCIGPLRRALEHMTLPRGDRLAIDGSAITAMDTAGAWLLLQIRQRMATSGQAVDLTGFRPEHARLIDYIASESSAGTHAAPPHGARSLLDRWYSISYDLVSFLAFGGEVVIALLHAVRHPGRIRWPEILADIYQVGVKALPIIGLLSFLMGVVIAYQGAVQLKLYGANIYIADLVGYSMLRELAPLLTAILICGRTGSAYAAQIGTMQVREEVAALQTIGIPPVDLLVLPKLISLIIVMPLVSVYADILSIFGGMVMAHSQLGIGFNAFIVRLEEAISYSTFMIGIGKAPVFAAIIAIVGCYQGFKVQGSAESVGRHTTISVVQSIFLVIVVDALFSILFSLLGV
jgi:phospholipid/cholesterol/gamma-HCH transport system permease protein